ncbi:MAG: hypothetical protein AMK72_06100 [Planctomycetes bacterium SM23_25]|nr:MAG: hypothetical protein AMS14_05055 [Planctomycetes bacterium DG_20]KPK48757.1 MAG: hypothetical protein AMK72_06100 [Planctomycetes bacterium SM23_25]
MTLPSPPPSADADTAVSTLMRVLGVVMLVVPIVGTLINVALLTGLLHEWAQVCRESRVPEAGMLLSVVVLFGSHFHYRRTRMSLDIASRIAANLWLFSSVWALWTLVLKPN